ncbi:Hint domain-containing protein [Rhodophyticola sp. CCM32]|uniref:Hint domain-containing protein n=1 Tax=Rhodophyticola sp. CCM32 TaxID=2916397 RepID=UPI00107F99C7|nr:Hint domain-containing protein [Rhodophyticola sp. CCM32]QBY00172.1 Hint domain-containing protein [Rhodophyticola sp. CCM32]
MTRRTAQFTFPTYPATAFKVSTGAHEGDAIGLMKDVVPGDSYRLSRQVAARDLAICDGPQGQEVADGSDIGTPGNNVVLDLCHTLMAPDGSMVDLLVLTLWSDARTTQHILPLTPLHTAVDYELVASETDSVPRRFADIASVSFMAGTHLTLANGSQKTVEELQVGDKILTRNNGAQGIKWIGQQTMRATGALAPIRITEGTLNTARDLRLSPHHRLFIWQRTDEVGTGRAELMVKAGYLVNGDTVLREEGGHVDTFHILFDGHEIIYAEGIAVESLLVTGQTRATLPEDLDIALSESDRLNAAEIEVSRAALDGEDDAVERLTRASKGASKD